MLRIEAIKTKIRGTLMLSEEAEENHATPPPPVMISGLLADATMRSVPGHSVI